jgi:hypothetical protein
MAFACFSVNAFRFSLQAAFDCDFRGLPASTED